MIVVIEGITACGKSTWCSANSAGTTVAETGRIPDPPDRALFPERAADFWVHQNLNRWRAATEMERSAGIAICDTDPLKLHYVWGLWKIGEAREIDWRLELAATRAAFKREEIGFADLYYVELTDIAVARQRMDEDRSRSRRNFELHARLQPPLIAWYEALNVVLPGRVFFSFPDAAPDGGLHHAGRPRYDIAAFDDFVARL